MQISTSRCLFTIFTAAFVLLILFFASFTPALANGKGHQHPGDEKSEHMQAMLALKNEIPEEYQIMERTPVLPNEESISKGKNAYLQSCSVCHGETGNGKGPAAPALKTPPANFLDIKHSAVYGPGEKFWIIGHGSGKTGMPAFPNISILDRWHIVNYILSLQQQDSNEQIEHGHH